MLSRTGVTILIPVDKQTRIEFLEQNVVSVLQQTFNKWELIFGIYGCGIGSCIEKSVKRVVQKYQIKGWNIRVIVYGAFEKHQAMNNMVVDATFDYISIMSMGSVWMRDKLEKQFPFLRKYDFVGTKCEHIDGMVQVIPVGDLENVNFSTRNPMCDTSVVFHKRDAYWNDGEDINTYNTWVRMKHNRRFYNVNKILCTQQNIWSPN